MNRFFFPCIALLLLLTAGQAQEPAAGLEWEANDQRLEVSDNGGRKVVEFHFRNVSKTPIRVLSVKTSCGCTVAKLQKEVYAPGEKGVLPVIHFSKGGAGLRTYRITLKTDENGGSSHRLQLQVAMNEHIQADKRMLVWEPGEGRGSKTISLHLKDSLQVVGATADQNVFEVHLADGPAPNEKLLRVTPLAQQGRTRIRLQTQPPLRASGETEFFAVHH